MGFMLSTPQIGKPKIVVPPSSKHCKTLIWLHGINAYSEEFLDIFEDPSMSPVDESTKVILLNAGLKTIAVTLGARVNSWFNIYSTDYTNLDEFYDKEDLDTCKLKISELIHDEVQNNLGGDYSKLFIGGFSQGAGVALYIASKLTIDSKYLNKNVKGEYSGAKYASYQKDAYQSNSKARSKSLHYSKFSSGVSAPKPSYPIIGSEYFNSYKYPAYKTKGVQHFEEAKETNANLGGVIFCNGLLLFKNPVKDIFKLNKFPIFVYHGTHDQMIDCEYTVEPFYSLQDKGYNIDIHVVKKQEHIMDYKEWSCIKKFLKN